MEDIVWPVTGKERIGGSYSLWYTRSTNNNEYHNVLEMYNEIIIKKSHSFISSDTLPPLVFQFWKGPKD